MSPLSMIEIHDHAFSNERFAYPLKFELEAVKTQEPKRRVRFCREKHVINSRKEYYTDEDIRTKWWTMEELNQIKTEAKAMSNVLRKGVKEQCDLTLAHRKTTLMLASNFKALMSLPSTTPDQDLQRWCHQNDGRRGLERFSSRDYCCFRRRDVLNTRNSVLQEQARQSLDGMYDDEVMAKLARAASRRSRTFSLFFGEADAAEARKIQEATERRAPPRKRSKYGEHFLGVNPALAA